MKRTYKLIFAAIAASLMLASCSDELITGESDNGLQSEGSRIIAVSFGPQTRTALGEDGLTPEFTGKDEWVKVSNSRKSEDCQITVDDDGNASFKTSLLGTLTAVYPATAAKMNGNAIEGVKVSSVQDGTFANANICMAENITENEARFINQTALFCITPGAGDNAKYVEVITAGYEIVNSVAGDYTTMHKVHVDVSQKNQSAQYYVSILVPDGLRVCDLSFADGSNLKTVNTGDDALSPISVNSIYTVNSNEWDEPYVEIGGKKWATQNLAISKTSSGNITFNNVTVPGSTTSEKVIIGDYFQWGAYAGYCGNATDGDCGLLIYTAISEGFSLNGGKQNVLTFKHPEQEKAYWFKTTSSGSNIGISPFHNGSSYTQYQGTGENKDGKTILELKHDAAHILLGGAWRMPTGGESGEYKALKDASCWAWDGEAKGYYVFLPEICGKSKGWRGNITDLGNVEKSNALLFFPAVGGGCDGTLNDMGAYAYYWSSSLYQSDTAQAYMLYFNIGDVNTMNKYYRRCGYPIRAVSE